MTRMLMACFWCMCTVVIAGTVAEKEQLIRETVEAQEAVIAAEEAAKAAQKASEQAAIESTQPISVDEINAGKEAHAADIAAERAAAIEHKLVGKAAIEASMEGKEQATTLEYNYQILPAPENTAVQASGVVDEPKKKAPSTNVHPEQDKFDYHFPGKDIPVLMERTENPNQSTTTSSSRDTQVEVCFWTDSWASESSFNIIGSDGSLTWDPNYDASWVGSWGYACDYATLSDGDYTIELYDSYGDGGLCADVHIPGVSTIVEALLFGK